MPLGLIGEKVGMTRVLLKDGTAIPVTVIKFPVNYVVQVKSVNTKDGYNALQVGAYEAKEKHLTKPLIGHFKKHGVPLLRRLWEFRVDNPEEFKSGQELRVQDVFKPGDLVDVWGISKGRGFAGVMKRWDFAGFPRSHGHRYHRAVGAIGQRTDPGRVWKGKKMPGHYGAKPVRVQGLFVVASLPEENAILVKGSALPGHNKGIVVLLPAVERIAYRKSQKLKQKRLQFIVENLVKEESTEVAES
uniref:Large ribosomal subunit protein uL3 n=1 Tax=Aquifex pyrophilus TaxID=2714 RepID=RL3_AQUPY|nr:RecName: Full=Large ribosomal subunit protein uL3; AltName: Full=50S ribosomal protein L3 [Aquifex pyrophilus]AAD08785.1 ribosomal protein L3 [Aquifex pyrophilus]